jgi:MFS transporter, SHS family, lactate transporter
MKQPRLRNDRPMVSPTGVGSAGVVPQILALDRDQRNAFLASFLGWALDAFDFFIVVFVVTANAEEFHASVSEVTFAILVTLAMRPLGALIFGLAADRWGRRMPLMVEVVFYSVIELLSGFAPSLAWLIFLRALYGIGMGDEWGVGATAGIAHPVLST